MSLNIAQIQSAGQSALGRGLSNDEAQTIMNATAGGDPDQVNKYLTNQKSQDALTNFPAQQAADFNNVATKGSNDITDFLTRYNTAVPKIISDVSSKYALPDQQAGVNALNTRIKTLQGNTDNSGAGGFASAGQVDSALNSRYLPQYSTALSNLTNSTALAQNEEGQLEKPYETEASMLNDRLTREMTGFTAEQQNALAALTAKLNAGVTLTKDEMDNANALAVAQEQYQAAVESQKIQSQNQTLPTGSTYYNPVTGVAYNPVFKPLKP